MPRNPDGTFRNARLPMEFPERIVLARWVETQVLTLKRLGLSFQTIAETLTQVGQGRLDGTKLGLTKLPEGTFFPPNYTITKPACFQTLNRALRRVPNLKAEEFRKLATERLEDQYFALQGGVKKGDPRSVEVAIKAIMAQAKLNGCNEPSKVELTGKDSGPISIVALRDTVRDLLLRADKPAALLPQEENEIARAYEDTRPALEAGRSLFGDDQPRPAPKPNGLGISSDSGWTPPGFKR